MKRSVRNYEELVQHFSKEVEDENDPVANYCFKKLQKPRIIASTAFVNDVLTELAGMCCLFQRRSITPLDAFELPKAKIRKPRGQYLGYIAHFNPEVKTTIANNGTEVNYDAVLRFIERVYRHL